MAHRSDEKCRIIGSWSLLLENQIKVNVIELFELFKVDFDYKNKHHKNSMSLAGKSIILLRFG